MPGMMGPPPPARVKLEEGPTEMGSTIGGPFHPSQPSQQWHPASLIPQPHFHPGFPMGSNPQGSTSVFHHPSSIPAQDAYLSKLPMHEIGAAGGVRLSAFQVEATPLQRPDQTQQPRGWAPAQHGLFQTSERAGAQLGNMSASSSSLAQDLSRLSSSTDMRPPTADNGPSHSTDSVRMLLNNSNLNESIWPNKLGSEIDNLLDGSSPFAHEPERRHTGLGSYPVPPSTGSMAQEFLTRLRTSPQDSTGATAFGEADSSYAHDEKMRRPYTALPQGGSKPPDFHFGKDPSQDNLGQSAEKERKQSSRFVQKLHAMVHDPEYQHLICWNSAGTSVVIINFDDFARDVLGKHFKHSNFSSFIRQLNMYGFYKVNKIPRGSRQSSNSEKAPPESQIWEFAHPKFLKNRPDLLEEIKRRAIETEGGRSDSRDHPMSAHAQANAYLSNQVNELNVRVGELNIGLDKAGMRNAHLRAFNMKLTHALRSTLDLLRSHSGGALPDYLAQHERLLSEAPISDEMSAAQASMMGAPQPSQTGAQLVPPSAQFVPAPGWSIRARADTNGPPFLAPATCAPHQASPISAPASMSMFPTREPQSVITPQASNSAMTITLGSGAGCSSSPVIVTQSSTRPPSSGTSSANTPSRPGLRLEARDPGPGSGKFATPEGLSNASSVTLLSSVSAPVQHPISFAFDRPVTASSTDNIPATGAAEQSDLQSMNFITANTSVDSLQQLQPNKQQRTMTPNVPSTVLGLPPRSSSLMAAFESTSQGHGQDGSSASGSVHTVSAQSGVPAQPSDINMQFSNTRSGPPSIQTQGLLSPSTSSLASLVPGPASGLSALTAADTSSTRTSLISFGTNPNAAITQHQQEQQAAAMAAFGKMQTSEANTPSPSLMGPPLSAQSQQHGGQRVFAFEGPQFSAVMHHNPHQIQLQIQPLPVLHTGPTATKRKMPS
ncbi:hypothetical protein OC846_002247 [Tilletia horrida]|uniref:HSF-type DNA-binding domain-containing protein n=1 Tax=Tilletia horrida TaxID=155126 RepID=A0AAN6GU21_9BASI|nr:hypothetical protein OC846_002247 [Tilletia horrida]KAK0568962.1 hypothetical protein OC861_001399 [Tilletia horrida]